VETVVRIEGAVERTLERLIKEGYYKTKAEAIRAGILELGREFDVIGTEEEQMVFRKIQKIEGEVKKGKHKLYSIDQIAKEEGVKI
jgi:Arc/MetJ-type ribon-helix-helix transcriptional regulator